MGIATDDLLARYSPEQFDEVMALVQLEGDAEMRLRQVITNGILATAQWKVEPEHIDPFLRDSSEAKSGGTLTPRQARARMAARSQGASP